MDGRGSAARIGGGRIRHSLRTACAHATRRSPLGKENPGDVRDAVRRLAARRSFDLRLWLCAFSLGRRRAGRTGPTGRRCALPRQGERTGQRDRVRHPEADAEWAAEPPLIRPCAAPQPSRGAAAPLSTSPPGPKLCLACGLRRTLGALAPSWPTAASKRKVRGSQRGYACRTASIM